MAGRKLRLQIQQSGEHGECGNPQVPRWYGQHAITTNDITGSVMKILIADSNGKRISITIGKNGGIRRVDVDSEGEGGSDAWIDPSNSENEMETVTLEENHILSRLLGNNPQAITEPENSLEPILQCVKEEVKDYEETEGESSAPFKAVAEIISEGYNSESMEPDVEEFHTVMEKIKSEERSLAGKFETVYIDSALETENDEFPKPREDRGSPEFSESANYTATQFLLCRLCAAQHKDMVYIFGENEVYKDIIEKIENCLSILVRENDTLPNQVCRLCLEKLELCHKFRNTVVEAEKQFIMLGERVANESKSTDKNSRTHPPVNEDLAAIKPAEELEPSVPPEKLEEKDEDIIYVGEAIHAETVAEESDECDIVKCRICGLFFGTPKTCFSHAEIHVLENYFPCSMCDTILTTRTESRRHVMVHMKRNSKTAMYTKQIASLEKAEKKIADYDNEESDDQDMVKCRLCGMYFGTGRSCYVHAEMHYSKNYYPCSMCEKIFICKADNDKHSNEHTARKPLQRRKPKEADKRTACHLHSRQIVESSSSSNSTKDSAEKNGIEEVVDDQTSTEQSKRDYDIIKCRICGLYFGTPRSCYMHSQIHYSENYYPCNMCDKIFTDKVECRMHSIQHTSRNEEQKRRNIHKEQMSGYNLRSTQTIESDKSLNSGKTVAEKDEADEEMPLVEEAANDQSDMVHCRICGLYFGNAKDCYTHSRIHAVENYLPCSMCDKIFTNETESRIHSEEHIVHNTDKKTTALNKRTISGIGPRSPPVTRSNRLPETAGEVVEKDENMPCNEEPVQEKSSNEQNNASNIIKCRICGLKFIDAEACYSHSMVHVEEDYYPCTMCYKTFVSAEEAHKHSLEHVTEPKHMCRLCGKGFANEDELEYHKIHHGRTMKKWYCEECCKIFVSESKLHSHMLNTHKEYKKCSCKICGQEFRSDRQLKGHQLKHTNLPYRCPACKKRFSSSTNLKIHRLHRCRRF